jgi:hypothetical protein
MNDKAINPTHVIPDDIAESYPHGIKTTEFAVLLGVPPSTVRYHAKKGLIKTNQAIRNSHHHIPLSSVIAYATLGERNWTIYWNRLRKKKKKH